jgi:muconolactone delta-isomerase
MKILALGHDLPSVCDDQFTRKLLHAEAQRAWELHQSGIIRELYFRADRQEAVLMLECANVGEARSVLNTLPLVRDGLIGFELIPLIPYPGFARLFSTNS